MKTIYRTSLISIVIEQDMGQISALEMLRLAVAVAVLAMLLHATSLFVYERVESLPVRYVYSDAGTLSDEVVSQEQNYLLATSCRIHKQRAFHSWRFCNWGWNLGHRSLELWQPWD